MKNNERVSPSVKVKPQGTIVYKREIKSQNTHHSATFSIANLWAFFSLLVGVNKSSQFGLIFFFFCHQKSEPPHNQSIDLLKLQLYTPKSL